MFSEAFVCPQGVSVQGVPVQGRSLSGGLCDRDPPPHYDGRLGGTHPTGMHSC